MWGLQETSSNSEIDICHEKQHLSTPEPRLISHSWFKCKMKCMQRIWQQLWQQVLQLTLPVLQVLKGRLALNEWPQSQDLNSCPEPVIGSLKFQ